MRAFSLATSCILASWCCFTNLTKNSIRKRVPGTPEPVGPSKVVIQGVDEGVDASRGELNSSEVDLPAAFLEAHVDRRASPPTKRNELRSPTHNTTGLDIIIPTEAAECGRTG